MTDVAALFRTHERELTSAAWRIVRSLEDARDVVQEAFARLLETLRTGGEIRNPRAWLFRAAINLSISRVRRRPPIPPREPTAATTPDDRRALLDRAVAELPERQRVVFLLRHGEGMRVPDVAEVLGVAPTTVAIHLTRALQALREKLAPHVEALQ